MIDRIVPDQRTADAFSTSWNNLPEGSVYSVEQFEDWLAPVKRDDVEGERVLELGCGGGSLLVHMSSWRPRELVGVELGSSVAVAERNLVRVGAHDFRIEQSDLVTFSDVEPYGLVYCIGVLHHLKNPQAGFEAVLRNTRSGGRFHCWVYAYEGNAVVRWVVDPVRRLVCGLPWWVVKYLVATPMAVPFYLYAKSLSRLRWSWLRRLPLYEYSLWISERGFPFFRHVAFDQLVAPQTAYIRRSTVEQWLESSGIDQQSRYLIRRNGNSWKFGGRRA